MVDPLMAAFDVGAAVTGNLAALYLYVYAVLQLPVGLLLDRFGCEINASQPSNLDKDLRYDS